MKSLARSKSRLSKYIDHDQRVALSLNLLDHVMGSSTRSSVDRIIVLCTDPDVMSIANDWGAEYVIDAGGGLNRELRTIIDRLSNLNTASIYIPADLPLLTEDDIDNAIDDSNGGEVITLCPDNRMEGTNGLVIPPTTSFRPSLGNKSLSRHLRRAKMHKDQYVIHKSEGWGIDLDSPKDLESVMTRQTGFEDRMFVFEKNRPR